MNDKSNKSVGYVEKFINKYKIEYIKKIENNIFKPTEFNLYDRLKFISVTASEMKPSENINEYILRSFMFYMLGPIFIILGIILIILSLLLGFYIITVFSLIFISAGVFELLRPYKVFKFFVNSDFKNFENGLFNSRFELIRIMYNNFIMYGNILYIDERVKLNKYVYTYFTFLNFEEGVSYDKIINSAQFFTNLDFEKYIKDIGTYIREQNIVQFYKKKEEELKIQENSIMMEKATALSSIATLLIFAIGISGLLIGIGSTIQPIIIQIYNNIMKSFSGGMVSQVSNELSMFDMILTLPPLYYFYLLLFLIGIASILIIQKLSKKMISV